MAERHVITALKRKYGQLAGALKHHRNPNPEATKRDLEHVGAVLLMFSPGEDLAAIRPVRPYKTGRGSWLRLALSILRKAEKPLGGREIARRIIAAGHASEADLLSIECSLYPALERLEGRGLELVERAPKRWATL